MSHLLLCRVFGTTDVLWSHSNWRWSDCSSTIVCKKWGNTNVLWSEANWRWPECIDCWKWSTATVRWLGANWLWSQCKHVEPEPTPSPELINQPGVDATTLIQPWIIEPWNPFRAGERKKKLIRLICKANGMEYDASKEVKDTKLSVDDIKLTIKNVDIDLDTKLEE